MCEDCFLFVQDGLGNVFPVHGVDGWRVHGAVLRCAEIDLE